MNAPSFGLRAAITVKARTLSGLLMTDGLFLELLRCDAVGEIARLLSETEGYRGFFHDTHPEDLHRTDLEARLSLVPFLRMRPFLHYVDPVRKKILLAWKARFDADVIKRILRYVQAGGGSREILRRMLAQAPLTFADGDRLLAAGQVEQRGPPPARRATARSRFRSGVETSTAPASSTDEPASAQSVE